MTTSLSQVATILFGGGFPRSADPTALRHTQTAIYNVQLNIEEVQKALYPGRVLISDRGTGCYFIHSSSTYIYIYIYWLRYVISVHPQLIVPRTGIAIGMVTSSPAWAPRSNR